MQLHQRQAPHTDVFHLLPGQASVLQDALAIADAGMEPTSVRSVLHSWGFGDGEAVTLALQVPAQLAFLIPYRKFRYIALPRPGLSKVPVTSLTYPFFAANNYDGADGLWQAGLAASDLIIGFAE